MTDITDLENEKLIYLYSVLRINEISVNYYFHCCRPNYFKVEIFCALLFGVIPAVVEIFKKREKEKKEQKERRKK